MPMRIGSFGRWPGVDSSQGIAQAWRPGYIAVTAVTAVTNKRGPGRFWHGRVITLRGSPPHHHWSPPMKRILLALALTTLTATAFAADAPGLPVTKAPAGAEVYIVSHKD